MIRTTRHRARRARRCDNCRSWITAGAVYLTHVASPNHDDLGNPGWWRMSECATCAHRYHRIHLIEPGVSHPHPTHRPSRVWGGGCVKPFVLLAAYIATVFVANWLTGSFGLVVVGFGLLVTAGTYSAGFALGLRDALHEVGGIRWVLAGIAVGAALSAVVSPSLALASGAAFLLAELLDLAVYTPLRRRGHRRAVIASNLVGGIADTLVFLALAGFPIVAETVGGQVLVKAMWCTGAYLLIREVVRRALPRQRQLPKGA